MRLRQFAIGLSTIGLLALTGQAGLVLKGGGISGYSGNPATNSGKICNDCHSGGTTPTVTLSGPLLVEKGAQAPFSLLIQGGQKIAGGFDVSVTGGTLIASDSGTRLRNSEVVHSTPRAVDANGDVAFNWDWTAPASTGTVTMYGAGCSVNLNNNDNGDKANADVLQIQVVDCMVKFSTYGAGTPGSGGSVPALTGADNLCSGGYTLNVSGGLGAAPAFLWLAGSSANIPFAGGNILVNIGDPLFTSMKLKLGGAPGVPGAGGLNLPGPDVTALAGLDVYLQTLIFDAGATKGVALSNGLLMDIG